MKIAISGASGYIGQHLTLFFTEKGDEVVPLGRNLFKEENFDELCHRVESCDVVINLAGASINKRWTKAYKQELYDSRIRTTHQLVNAINTRDILPKLFISTSAVGYYPTSGEYDEYNNRQGEDCYIRHILRMWDNSLHPENMTNITIGKVRISWPGYVAHGKRKRGRVCRMCGL